MKYTFLSLVALLFITCAEPRDHQEAERQLNMDTMQAQQKKVTGNYAEVNGIKMYYEVYGSGPPLVLIHGGGSTIGTTFGRIIPLLAESHQVIGVELQAHGHTSDRGVPSSFEQDADDVAELLKHLKIKTADVFGFSNGGNTAMRLAMRHPEKVAKLIVASSFYQREGMNEGFWDFMEKGTFADMPQVYKLAFKEINPDSSALMTMFTRDAVRMKTFTNWTDEDLKSIKSSALIVIGDRDVMRPEHAVKMHRLIPGSRLLVLPAGHGDYMGEILSLSSGTKDYEGFVAIINEFLNDPVKDTK